jgi:hypothetical protein
MQYEYKSKEFNLVAKFYDNYHQPDGAASSLSHGPTTSFPNLPFSMTKANEK